MRLKRLKLSNYGCFQELDLALATEPGRITLITAPNGSGKSVLRQAFHDLLFDIPVQSPMRFRHGSKGMALHAEAVDADGVGFTFGWVRNGKPPRVFSDAARFDALRFGVTPQQLERMFALDTDRLRKGGTDLKGGATLSAALLAGTGELASAKSVKAVIDKRRQDNWGQSKSKPPLNAAAGRLDAARKLMRDSIQQPESRVREERDLARREDELAEARKVRDDLAAEIKRLNRIVLTRSHLEALFEAETWLLTHADAPALPLDLETSLAAARDGVALATVEHEAAQKNLLRAAEAAGQISRDAACTAVADRLERLSGKLGEAEKASIDIVERRKEHAACIGNLRAELEAIGSPFPVDQAGKTIPTVGLRAEVHAAITTEVGIRTKCEVARNAVRKARAGLVNAEAAVRAAQPLPEGLAALLAEIRADRKPMAHAEEVAAKVEAAAAQVRRCLAMVPGWSGTAEQLRDLAVKGDSAFERLDATVKTMAAAAAEKHAARANLAKQDDFDRRALSTLQRHDLPDASSIASARAERDRGMRLVISRAFGQPPTAGEESAYSGGEPVPVVYERHVRAADSIADRRADELKQVQEAERLRLAIDEREEALGQAVRDEQHADAELASARQTWAAAVAPLELDGSVPLTELRQATAARRELVEALLAADIASAEQEKLTGRHQAWAGRLAATLGEPVAPLGSLLARADQLVASSQAAEREVANREAAIDAARRAVPEALDTLAAAEAAMESWRALWARLLRDLHRPEDESPAAVTAVLDGIDRLEVHHREATSLGRRIADMDDDLATFASGVAELAATVGQSVSSTPAGTARHLVHRHRAAEAAEAAWGQAQLTRAGAGTAAQAASEKLSGAQAVLAGVVASCGASDDQEAEARVAASRAHADQVLRRDQARKGIVEHGDGLTVDALRLETGAVPAEVVAERRRAAEEALAGAHVRTEAAAVSVSELAARLDTASSATDALDARVDYEAAAAEYERLLEDQLVLHLASTMLGDAMQVAEQALGDNSLARTSEMFAAVTDGGYGLEVHDGPEGEELYAVEREYPSERKALDQLSEGTRDQLYLVLRIQALREHCATKTPLPFIADDILQTFDDDRARAALRVLCDISAELQVVVLSHHPHLRRVAESLGPGLVRCLDLSAARLALEVV